jgi:hypothetical protein
LYRRLKPPSELVSWPEKSKVYCFLFLRFNK